MAEADDKARELLRACAQCYQALENLVSEMRGSECVGKVDFSQSMFGPDPKEWPGSPVGFSWDIDVHFTDDREESYTFDITCETQWCVGGERSKQGRYGPETEETIFDGRVDDVADAVALIRTGTEKFTAYCRNRTGT